MDYTFDWTNQRRTQTTSTTDLTTHNTATAEVRPATQSQVQLYNKLCLEKKRQPRDWAGWNYDEMSSAIQELKAFYPMSDAQRKIITEKEAKLREIIGERFPITPDDKLSEMTGGREGSASKHIASLIDLERQHNDQAQPTNNKIHMMVTMYFCPDVAFEEFNITRRIYTGEYVGEVACWRRCTPQEFAEQIKEKMTNREASEFIDKYRGAFHTWSQTRIRPEQVRYIRQLEGRLARLEKPTVVEWAQDDDGNYFQITRPLHDRSSAWSPTAYNHLPDVELNMLSKDDATILISRLKAELEDKGLTAYTEESDGSQTFEEIRTAQNKGEWMEREFTALNDLMFSLMAVAGHEQEEFQGEAVRTIVEKYNDESQKEIVVAKMQAIYDWMMYLLDENFIGFDGLTQLCEKSELAQQIMTGRF